VDRYQTWRYSVDSRQHGFFLAKRSRKPQSRPTPDPSSDDDRPNTPTTPLTPGANLGYTWQIGPLSAYETGFFEGEYSDDCFACFADPSNYTSDPGPIAPAWVLRNLLVLVRQRWKRDRIQILCYRETQTRRDAARSIILDMELSRQPSKRPARSGSNATTGTAGSSGDTAKDPSDPSFVPKVVGWERNSQGKLAGRMVDLTEYMDPKKLADSSVDLNLKLMKWRISPSLNLDKIKETKCLLLGAGTLGSYVSRNLLGWGVRRITFVDNGNVSFSNPVRQPLFNFKDCLEGGKKKALCAAEALKEIYPGVDATGHVLSVPMAGHPTTDAARTKAEYEKLKELIDSHDVIFLLMDSRESRWLPTVMGKAAGKIVVNAALGFDTYVVMRHGVRPETTAQPLSTQEIKDGMMHSTPPSAQPSGPVQTAELGCYFCNDVVAPSDSQKDLTLDQQCTVTRPGIAAIASALLVELLVSIIQHSLGASAPASLSNTEDRGEHPLGLVPHQIRGFLSNFTNLNVVGKSYDCCSACSEKVIRTYEAEGWEFVLKALNERDYVEELSGLKEVQRLAEEAATAMEAMDLSDEDELGEEIDDEGELI
jgi:ubiquitin-like modifier-activating enzyme ATG7